MIWRFECGTAELVSGWVDALVYAALEVNINGESSSYRETLDPFSDHCCSSQTPDLFQDREVQTVFFVMTPTQSYLDYIVDDNFCGSVHCYYGKTFVDIWIICVVTWISR